MSCLTERRFATCPYVNGLCGDSKCRNLFGQNIYKRCSITNINISLRLYVCFLYVEVSKK